MDSVKIASYSLLVSLLIHLLPLLGVFLFSTQNITSNKKVMEIIFQSPRVNGITPHSKVKMPHSPPSHPFSSKGKVNEIGPPIHSESYTPGENGSNIFSYNSEIAQGIKGHLKISYPRIARERGLEGRVFLIIELTNQGEIKEIIVDQNKSTAHQILIDEVIQALHRGQIRPISSTDGIKTEIVIDFKLEN